MATLIVFENKTERDECCAGLCHDWHNQPNIFGTETQKMLDTCTELMRVSLFSYFPKLSFKEHEMRKQVLLRRIYGIAKTHGLYVRWRGLDSVRQPDRFEISGHGHERLAFIQC